MSSNSVLRITGSSRCDYVFKNISIQNGSTRSGNGGGLQRFNACTGSFDSVGFDQGASPAGVDFRIIRDEGYILYMKQRVVEFDPAP